MMQFDKPKILVVDDLAENRQVLGNMLAEVEATIITSSSGNEALELVKQQDFSIIVLDIEMPEMDGFQVLNLLTADEQSQHVPVILLASQLSHDKQNLYGNIINLVDLVYKPVNKEVFLAKINNYLELHKYREIVKARYDESEKLIKAVHEGVLGVNEKGIILFANASSARMLGTTTVGLMGVYLESLLEEPHHKAVSEWKEHPIRKACLDGNILHVKSSKFRRKDGSQFGASFAAVPVSNMNGIEIIFAFKETVGENKEGEEKLSQLSNRDHLTGLPNREKSEELIEAAVERAAAKDESMAVLIMDLDHFRYINESLGHEMGDKLIKDVVDRLQAAIRETDAVARIGGDQFPIILDGLKRPQDAGSVAHKILGKLGKPFLLEGHEISIGASVGIATYPVCGDNPADLLKNAGTAAGRAKLLGGNNYQFFNLEMNTSSVERLELESQLHYAIEKNELCADIHQVVNLSNNKVEGFKLNVVWQHRSKGAIQGNYLRELAESTGMQLSIGEWSLKSGFEKYNQRVIKDCEVVEPFLMLNLAAVHIMQENFVDKVSYLLEQHKIPSDRVIFLFEEHSVISRTHDCRKIIEQLHQTGFKIAINNFGTGFASLTLLEQIPLDFIVIGPSFIDLSQSSKAGTIVEGIVNMAHNLHIKVVGCGLGDEQKQEVVSLNFDFAMKNN